MQKKSFIENSIIYYFNKEGGGVLRKESNAQIHLRDVRLIAICRRVFGDSDFDFLLIIDSDFKQYAFDYRSLGRQNIQKIFDHLNLNTNFELGEAFDFKYIDEIVFPKSLVSEKLFQNKSNFIMRNLNFFKHLLSIQHWAKGKLNHKLVSQLFLSSLSG